MIGIPDFSPELRARDVNCFCCMRFGARSKNEEKGRLIHGDPPLLDERLKKVLLAQLTEEGVIIPVKRTGKLKKLFNKTSVVAERARNMEALKTEFVNRFGPSVTTDAALEHLGWTEENMLRDGISVYEFERMIEAGTIIYRNNHHTDPKANEQERTQYWQSPKVIFY